MIERKKRNYIILIVMSCFMIFTVVAILISFEQGLSYGEIKGTIRSVNVRQVKAGSYDDSRYYIESTVKYDYTLGGKNYTNSTNLRKDYSGMEGESVTIIYSKFNPRKSSIGSRKESLFSGFSSIIGSICLLCFIIHDIRSWVLKRKEENEKIEWHSISYDELIMLKNEQKKKTRLNIFLFVLSGLLTFVILFFAIPLWAFTIARAIDVKLCYKNLPSI